METVDRSIRDRTGNATLSPNEIRKTRQWHFKNVRCVV